MVKKLFNINTEGYDNYYYIKNINVSNEMISPQIGDYIVNELDKEFANLREFISTNNIETTKDAFTSSTGKAIVARMEKLLLDRFGFSIILLPTSDTWSSLSIPPKGYSVLFQKDTLPLYDEIIKIDSERIDPNSVDDPDGEKMCIAYIQSLKALDKSFYSGIHIDNNKAKITGLSKDFACYITCNIMEDLEFGRTTREEVAVLLHEVGHLYSHLEYSYKNVHNTIILTETFLDNFRNKNKSKKESLLIAYSKLTNDNSLANSNSNVITLSLVAYNNIVNRSLIKQNHSLIDSEMVADSFASKFGLGAELVSSFDKTAKLVETYAQQAKKRYLFQFIGCLGGGLATFATYMPILWLINGALLIPIAAYSIFKFLTINTTLLKDEKINSNAGYDDLIRRYERLRLDAIRMLRSGDYPKAVVSYLLDELNTIDTIIKNTPAGKVGIVETISRFFNSDKVEMKRLEQITEDLMENDLYIAAAKLKQGV